MSTSPQLARQPATSRMSISRNSWRRHCAAVTACEISSRLAACPVAKLSIERTVWSRRRSVSTRCEPMKPALPVTSQRNGRLRRLSFAAANALTATLSQPPQAHPGSLERRGIQLTLHIGDHAFGLQLGEELP